MRVVVVSCVFPPEPLVSAQTSAQIADELVQRGHYVKVITAFPSRPAGKLYPGYARRLFKRQVIRDGFELVRCFTTLSSESRILSRFFENFWFGLTGGWAVLTSSRPDLIYANTWPIFATGILFLISRLRGIPLVISVQDIYPDSLVSQQRIQANRWLVRWMRWLDGSIARRTGALIVISERFAAIYRDERGVDVGRLHIVPNWSEGRSISRCDDQALQFRTQHNIPAEAFLCVYAGNIGAAAGVETLIQSLRYLGDVEGLHMMIAGEGGHLEACQALANKIGSTRLRFHSPWRIEETGLVLGAADLLLLPTRGSQSLASVPSKLITYLLTARPLIALALPQSDLSRQVERSGCGWVVEPDRPDLLAAKIREVMELEPAQRTQRGETGRKFALQNLTREACLPRVINILERVAARDPG